MPRDFCTRVTRKIRRLGHDEKVARRYAHFFCISLVSVVLCPIGSSKRTVGHEKKPKGFFELSGAAPGLEGRGAICDEIRRILKRILMLPSGLFAFTASTGIPAPGPRAVWIMPGYSRKRR